MHSVDRRNYRLGPTGRKAKTDDHRSVRLERPLSAYPKFISSGPDQHLSVPRPPSKSRERMKASGQAEQTVPTPHQSPDRQVAVRTYGRTQRRWQEEASDTLCVTSRLDRRECRPSFETRSIASNRFYSHVFTCVPARLQAGRAMNNTHPTVLQDASPNGPPQITPHFVWELGRKVTLPRRAPFAHFTMWGTR